ncbi:MAG: ATP-binding protein [Rhodopila sp.]|jgi:signal transduction histidine kinase/CheY-like chemotaxis protein
MARKSVRSVFDVWAARLPKALATGLGLARVDDACAAPLRAAQIGAIVRLTPLAMGASCLNAVILITTLARMGSVDWPLWVWAATLFALVVRFARAWWTGRRRAPDRPVTSSAIRRAVINGGLFGALWGAVPVITFPGAPATTQLLVGCLVAGMMCAGGSVLAPVPLAGVAYVLAVAAGTFYTLLQEGAPVYLGLAALMVVCTSVVIVNLNCNAFLFIDHFLAEARIKQEVAAREQAQALSAHAERMTALGELAGGIAHDFNNTLQAIAGNAELIGRRLNRPREVQRLARLVLEAAERGGAISRRLLAFGRRGALCPAPVDPVAMLTGTSELLRRTLGSSIVVHAIAAPDLPWFLADRRQLETVLVNLVSNARDALPDGGDVTLSAASETVTGRDHQPPLEPGNYVRLSVADSGTGMDSATLARAAEPFFTTKPMGKGTGLGLSMAKGFAEQSGGALMIASEPRRGTVVTLWLPQTDKASRREVAVPEEVGNGHHVLVVDDDQLGRDAIVLSLKEAGFIVVGAENGVEALEHIDSGARVDAMVTDFAMPGMNGLDLVSAMQARTPALPSFLLTGHVGDLNAAMGQRDLKGRFTLLQKPIRPGQLARMLAEAFD